MLEAESLLVSSIPVLADWLGRTENKLFLLARRLLFGLKYPNHIQFSFQNKIIGGEGNIAGHGSPALGTV